MAHKGWRVVEPQHNQLGWMRKEFMLEMNGHDYSKTIVSGARLVCAAKRTIWNASDTLNYVCFYALNFRVFHIRCPLFVVVFFVLTLHYENKPIQIYTENFTTKNENFQIKNSDIFHNSAQNIDCGYSLEPPRRGGSNEYPQFMFLSRNKKNNVYPCKPQFYFIKVGFKGVNII